MGRKLRSNLPTNPQNLVPKTPDLHKVNSFEEQSRVKNFDKHHSAKNKSVLSGGDEVYIKDRNERATVLSQPYIVEGDRNTYRRNRVQLGKLIVSHMFSHL